MAFPSGTAYHADSDADDEYERSVMTSPTQLHTDSDASPTDSDLPSENTPTTYGNGGDDHSLPRTIITEWTADECAQFVAGLGIRQYCDALIEHNVDGISIVDLHHDGLKEMGITSVGHRLTILKSVYDIKVEQDIPIEPDHYIPLSAEQSVQNETATREDIQRWARGMIKSRDERLIQAEDQLKDLTEAYNKLRQELEPIFKMASKRQKPLPEVPSYHPASSNLDTNGLDVNPSPEGQQTSERNGLTRGHSVSQKKSYLGAGSKNHSPTHPPPSIQDGRIIPDQPFLDPSAAATAAANRFGTQMSYKADPLLESPSFVPQYSPTSPGPHPTTLPSRVYREGGVTASGGRNMHEYPDEYRAPRRGATSTPPNSREPPNSATSIKSIAPSRNTTNHNLSTASTMLQSSNNWINGAPSSGQIPASASGSAASADTPDIFKSLKVSLEDPCHKVLPAALRRYKIQADWHQYALYIVYGDQERCIGWDEKPLALLKDLEQEGQKLFMQLRKLAPSTDTPSSANMRPPGSGAGGMLASSGASTRTGTNMSLDVPGGVL